jgi:site-specific DNA-methyltransferase (adenine-specific)
MASEKKNRVHPTQKPVPLMEWLVSTYSNEGDTVLDNCMGSGPVGVAAKLLNRNFVGIESNEEYFQVAKSRIKV